MTDRERPLQAPNVLSITRVHTCTGVSLTTSNILVICETTYRTGLRHNNCTWDQKFSGLVSTGHVHSTLSKTLWKPATVYHECGRRLHERNTSKTGRGFFTFLSFFSGRERPLPAGKPESKFSFVLERELGQKICIQYWHLIWEKNILFLQRNWKWNLEGFEKNCGD